MPKESSSKYFSYALGELVLVVVGILIALQINNWNEDRLAQKQEIVYLESMLADLHEDGERIDRAIKGNDILLDGLDRLLELLSEPNQDPVYLRQLFLHALVYTYWYLQAEFSELTMTQLKSSGGLFLIRDKDVRDAMLTYEQGLESCKHQYREMTNYFHVVEASQKQLFNLPLGKRSYEFIEQDYMHILEPLSHFESLVAEGNYLIEYDPKRLTRYYNDVLFYRTALNNTAYYLKEQKKLGAALNQLIHDRYPIE